MKGLIAVIILNYFVLGFVHATFASLLKKEWTPRFAITEFFLWPRRTWRGLKAIKRDMGKLDLS